MIGNDTLLVSVDFSGEDTGVLVVGRKEKNQAIKIVNEDSKVTVVMWDDGTKTIVKCSEADQYDSYAAYCAAFAKKCYGTNSQLKKTIENLTVVQESKPKKKQNIVIFDETEV